MLVGENCTPLIGLFKKHERCCCFLSTSSYYLLLVALLSRSIMWWWWRTDLTATQSWSFTHSIIWPPRRLTGLAILWRLSTYVFSWRGATQQDKNNNKEKEKEKEKKRPKYYFRIWINWLMVCWPSGCGECGAAFCFWVSIAPPIFPLGVLLLFSTLALLAPADVCLCVWLWGRPHTSATLFFLSCILFFNFLLLWHLFFLSFSFVAAVCCCCFYLGDL